MGYKSDSSSDDVDDSFDEGPKHSPLVKCLGYPWSIAVGASVASCGIFSTHLNAHAPPNVYDLHAIYTSTIALLLGGVLLLPSLFLEGFKVTGKPTKWYSCLGGVAIFAEFMTIPAFGHLGVQVVLLAMLLGMLFTGMVFDLRSGELTWHQKRRFLGFFITMTGVVLDYYGPQWFAPNNTAPLTNNTAPQTNSTAAKDDNLSSVSTSLLYVVASFLCGVGYCLMAKCNHQLADDLGSATKATMVCAVVAVLARAPLMLWIAFGKGITPMYASADWVWWVAAAAQSAFYNGSLAFLPGVLGYAANYIVMLIGKLGASSVIDALGLGGMVVPIDVARSLGVAIVIVGTVVFSVSSWRQLFRQAPAATGLHSENDSDDDLNIDGSDDFDLMTQPTSILNHP